MCFVPQRRALFRYFFNILTSKSGPRPSVFNTFDLEMCFAPQRRALFRHLNFQKWSGAEVFCTFWLGNVLRATTACTFSTSQLPKVVRSWGVLYILTWKCASRHNGVHFFDISTSKSGPKLRCFVHFDLEMCFAPQRRALFRHLNFQKWSGAEVFCTFWLGNVLRATTACNFSSLIWPAGSAPAALASLLFDPPEPHIIGKTQCFATFLPFRASTSSFFDLFSFDSSHLCFSTVHIVGSFTSKLPSTMHWTLDTHWILDVVFFSGVLYSHWWPLWVAAKKATFGHSFCWGVLASSGIWQWRNWNHVWICTWCLMHWYQALPTVFFGTFFHINRKNGMLLAYLGVPTFLWGRAAGDVRCQQSKTLSICKILHCSLPPCAHGQHLIWSIKPLWRNMLAHQPGKILIPV